MIHLPYKYAVVIYIILQLIALCTYLFADDASSRWFMLSSFGLTCTLIALYFSDKHWQREKERKREREELDKK